ncbi:hypothetical protein ACEPAG_1285 [Sanghuangporus baumii]
MVFQSPELYLDEIQEWLIIAHDIGISRSALDEHLRDAGISHKLLHKAAAERDEVARAQFRQYAQDNWVANQLVFVDETSKDDRTIYRHYGRSILGKAAEFSAPFVRGQCYSMIAALTVDGYMNTRVVEGSVDGDEFQDFIANDVLPRMNSWPGDNSVLILDNCAIHKREELREMVEAEGCQLIFLPAYSPDFNPIEESFSVFKSHLRRNWKQMQDAEDPEFALYEAATYITKDMAKAWITHAGYKF